MPPSDERGRYTPVRRNNNAEREPLLSESEDDGQGKAQIYMNRGALMRSLTCSMLIKLQKAPSINDVTHQRGEGLVQNVT